MTIEGRCSPQPVPQTAGLPLLGCLLDLRRMGLLGYLEAQADRYPTAFRFTVAGRSRVAVHHPEALERIFSSRSRNYVKGASHNSVRDVIGDGLATVEGEVWRRRRSLARPAFRSENLDLLMPVLAETTRRSLDHLRTSGETATEVDAHGFMTRLALNLVFDSLFGRGLRDEADVPYDTLAGAVALASERSHSVRLPRRVPTPGNLRLNRTLTVLHRAVDRVIRTMRDRQDRGEDDGRTLLARWLRGQGECEAAQHETGLNDRELRDEIVTLCVAGHETTALLLTWTLVLLDRHPEAAEEVRAEVDEVLGERPPALEDLGRLVFMRQVIDEVLRLRPPVWVLARDVVEDDEVRGFEVRGGDAVLPILYLAHRHPEFWPEPHRFDPSRFAPNKARPHPFAFLPFGSGPRVCIGKHFAYREALVVLASLFQRARVSLIATDSIRPVARGTLRPSGPTPVRLEWRRR